MQGSQNQARFHVWMAAALLLTQLAAGSVCQALQPMVRPNPSVVVACVQDPNDPFDPAVRFKEGKYRGQCMDTSTHRGPVVLSENENTLTVANLFDQGRYYSAEIPKDIVREVIFHIVPFASGVPGVLVAHTQLRFRLSAPITLRPQSGDPAATVRLDDLLISATYLAPPGIAYSATTGLTRSFNIVTRIMSSRARAKEEIFTDGSTIRQYHLNLTPSQMNEVLVVAIRRAAAQGYDHAYGLFSDNCTTETFDTLDEVIHPPTSIKPVRGSWLWLHDEVIKPSLKGLTSRGLIGPQSEINPMNTEFTCDAESKLCVGNGN